MGTKEQQALHLQSNGSMEVKTPLLWIIVILQTS